MKKTKLLKFVLGGIVAIALTVGIIVPMWGGGDPPTSGTITIVNGK
jgi:hypothetical protein